MSKILLRPLVAVLLSFAIASESSFAATVSTQQALSTNGDSRSRLICELERDDAVKTLEKYGVDTASAKLRIAALSDKEAADIVAEIDAMPAGGAIAETISIIAVSLFIILFITDLLGFTKFFSFTQR